MKRKRKARAVQEFASQGRLVQSAYASTPRTVRHAPRNTCSCKLRTGAHQHMTHHDTAVRVSVRRMHLVERQLLRKRTLLPCRFSADAQTEINQKPIAHEHQPHTTNSAMPLAHLIHAIRCLSNFRCICVRESEQNSKHHKWLSWRRSQRWDLTR